VRKQSLYFTLTPWNIIVFKFFSCVALILSPINTVTKDNLRFTHSSRVFVLFCCCCFFFPTQNSNMQIYRNPSDAYILQYCQMTTVSDQLCVQNFKNAQQNDSFQMLQTHFFTFTWNVSQHSINFPHLRLCSFCNKTSST
jgi:hypothetical protein